MQKRYTFLVALGIIFLATIMCLLMALTTSTAYGLEQPAQYDVDMTQVKHITEPFFKALAQSNIAVKTTYQCRNNYRADWLSVSCASDRWQK